MITKGNISTKLKPLLPAIFVFSLLIFIVGIIKRDTRLQNILTSHSSTGEFESSMILCSDFPRCFRIAGHGIGKVIEQINIFFYENVFRLDEYHTNYIDHKESIDLIHSISSIEFRALMLTPILVYLFSEAKTLKSKTLILISLTSIISGYPLVYIDRFYDMYLTIPDYGSIFVIGIYLLYRKRLIDKNLHFLAFMIFCVLFYENLSIALGIAELLDKKNTVRNRIQRFLISIFVTIIWVSFLVLMNILIKGTDKINLADTETFRNSNFSHLHLLIPAIIMLMFWPFSLGILNNMPQNKNDLFKNLDSSSVRLICGLLFTYLLAIFTSGIDAEGARQTLCTQILIYTTFMLRHNITSNKKY